MGRGPGELKHHRRGSGPRNFAGSEHSRRRSGRDQRLPRRSLRSDEEAALPFEQRLSARHRSPRSASPRTKPATRFSTPRLTRRSKARMAVVPADGDRVAHPAVRDHRRTLFSHHRADHARHLVLSRAARFSSSSLLPVEFDASHRAKIILQQMGIIQPGNGSRRREQSPQRRRLDLRRRFYRHVGQPALAPFDARSPQLTDESDALALRAPRRLTDLLSSPFAGAC